MTISLKNIADKLLLNNNYYILTHKFPDGDTLGSAFALCVALQKLNKKAKVLCNDDIPEKFKFLEKYIRREDFEPDFIISVDVADTNLLGDKLICFKNKIDLCIDHHAVNKDFAKESYVNAFAAANCENIYDLLNVMGFEIDEDIASCLYTGIATDTGCFKYTNVTAKTHMIAADLISKNIDFSWINKLMFDTKTKTKIKLEKLVMNSMEFFFEDKCAVVYITNDMKIKSNAQEDDIDGFASLPRQIEGVLVGLTFRQKDNGYYKISIRTDGKISAMDIGKVFGGGGHKAAGGCDIDEPLEIAKEKILKVVEKELNII